MKKYVVLSLVLLLSPTVSLTQNKKITDEKVFVQTAIGELVDKITILEIKSEKITDLAKLKNITKELAVLTKSLKKLYTKIDRRKKTDTEQLKKELKTINEQLWEIEDDIRDKERAKEFDAKFINLARSVYTTNDERCRVKRKINMLLGSELVEEKSYKEYK